MKRYGRNKRNFFDSLDWPDLIAPLVRQYGPARVWGAGLAGFGFPPTWMTGGREFLNLKSYLEQRYERTVG